MDYSHVDNDNRLHHIGAYLAAAEAVHRTPHSVELVKNERQFTLLVNNKKARVFARRAPN